MSANAHRKHRYVESVNRAQAWILSHQQPDGGFGPEVETLSHHMAIPVSLAWFFVIRLGKACLRNLIISCHGSADTGSRSPRAAATCGLFSCEALKQEVYRSLDPTDGEDPFLRTVTRMDFIPRGPPVHMCWPTRSRHKTLGGYMITDGKTPVNAPAGL